MITAFSTTKLKEPWMSPLPESVDIAFEQFVQELPQAYEAMAYEFRAFPAAARSKVPCSAYGGV